MLKNTMNRSERVRRIMKEAGLYTFPDWSSRNPKVNGVLIKDLLIKMYDEAYQDGYEEGLYAECIKSVIPGD